MRTTASATCIDDRSCPVGAETHGGALRLLVRGFVQGVGFRPFVLRLATQFGLAGRVYNSADGVVIDLEGRDDAINAFRGSLVSEAPNAAVIDEIRDSPDSPIGRSRFFIDASTATEPLNARLPTDVATCAHCQGEILDSANRRYRYPFTSCTCCGPRYSIILAAPYDRAATSMRSFQMCQACQTEYAEPDDRRLHAQTNACAACGPEARLLDAEGNLAAGPTTAIAKAVELLRNGRVLALKGLGGFQLLVRADQSEAVSRLRQRKLRPGKPFAVMVGSIDEAEAYAAIDSNSRRALMSACNPIVLVDKRVAFQKVSACAIQTGIATEVAPNVNTIGLLLPTTPLHRLLLQALGLPVVATSGNRNGEPLIIDDGNVCSELDGIADAFLMHNRLIVRRVDDSVVRTIANRSTVFRLARGYAPLPLRSIETLARKNDVGPILATGGHQQSAIAVWTGSQAVLSQHVGDLKSARSRAAFGAVYDDLRALYRCQPEMLACDLHPEYFTTHWASIQKLPVLQVQHHFAHAVACMAENDLLDKEVLAFIWDGTGYGPDGTIWGGEALTATCTAFERVASLMPFPLPGGEAAIHRPARAALGLLWRLLGSDAVIENGLLLERLGLFSADAKAMVQMMQRGVNSPWTSSMGRLFDGVSSLLLGIRETTYSGEAAIRLESIADPICKEAYSLSSVDDSKWNEKHGAPECSRGDWRPMLSDILRDLSQGVAARIIAARFHNALVHWAVDVAKGLPELDVVLSGGCFQNRLLTEHTMRTLQSSGRKVYCHGLIPPGDGGLAAGQLAVAIASTIGNQKQYQVQNSSGSMNDGAR